MGTGMVFNGLPSALAFISIHCLLGIHVKQTLVKNEQPPSATQATAPATEEEGEHPSPPSFSLYGFWSQWPFSQSYLALSRLVIKGRLHSVDVYKHALYQSNQHVNMHIF